MQKFLERQVPLLGEENIKILQSKNILVLGAGGVGGNLIEALVRCGVQNITIVDNDTINESNINRQVVALNSTIGQLKVEALKQRMLDINKDLNITALNMYIQVDNIMDLKLETYDYIVDAIDTVTIKIELAKICYFKKYKLISSMGTGNKLDPTKLEITDIFKTKNDPIAKVVRYKLKKANVKKLKVLCSTEVGKKVDYTKYANLKTPTKNAPGTISFVPSVAGIIIASYVVRDILKLLN